MAQGSDISLVAGSLVSGAKATRPWRNRLLYMLLSLFLIWHTAAMVIGPAPQTSSTQAARELFSPYMSVFMLDNPWDFYAPIIGYGHELRYEIEDTGGKKHQFIPTESVSWFHPGFWWHRAWNDAIVKFPESFADHVSALLCDRHKALQPISVTISVVKQKRFSRADYLAGKRPFNAEFTEETALTQASCTDE